jgi:hypothetical protein
MNTRSDCSSSDSLHCILMRKTTLQLYSMEVDNEFRDFNQRKENTMNYPRLSYVRDFHVDELPRR